MHTIQYMIQIKDIRKNYNLNIVLRNINLHIGAGEFVTLVGSNGAGKSTLMRIVATLLQPSSGEVKIGGWPLATHADKVRRHIGLVSHQPMVYSDLSAIENLQFFARLYRLENPRAVAYEALRKVGLFARQRDVVGSFSRGMMQRLTIARATLHNPEVLLLDEPYTGLDQDASRLLDELLVAERENGRTIFMITHDLAHGLNLCHRIAILNKGKIVHELNSENVTSQEFLDIYAHHTGRKPA